MLRRPQRVARAPSSSEGGPLLNSFVDDSASLQPLNCPTAQLTTRRLSNSQLPRQRANVAFYRPKGRGRSGLRHPKSAPSPFSPLKLYPGWIRPDQTRTWDTCGRGPSRTTIDRCRTTEHSFARNSGTENCDLSSLPPWLQKSFAFNWVYFVRVCV